MQAIIITELLKINEGKVKTNYRVINLDGQEPTLNNKLGFIPVLNQYIPVKLDMDDKTGKTYLLESDTPHQFEDEEIVIQYTNVMDIRDIKSVYVIKTEKSILTDKVINLEHVPSNLFGLCPMLNFGYVLVRSINDGTSVKVPSCPNNEDDTKKSILLRVTDEVFEQQLKDKEVTVQYIYQNDVDKVLEITVVCNEVVEFSNGKMELSNTIGNINDESPFLNFELASTHLDNRSVEFSVMKLDDNICGSLFFTSGDLEILDGKNITIQYTKKININDAVIESKFLDTKIVNGVQLNYNSHDIKMSAYKDAKLQDLANKFAENSINSPITRSGDIIDGEFVVMTE